MTEKYFLHFVPSSFRTHLISINEKVKKYYSFHLSLCVKLQLQIEIVVKNLRNFIILDR